MSKKVLEVVIRQEWKGKGKRTSFWFSSFVTDRL